MSQHDFRVIPILRIFDLERANAFYVNYLGCRVDWTHRHAEGAPAYLQVSRGSLILHLTEHAGDCGPESTVLVWCTGLQALHHELSAKDTANAKPAIAIAPLSTHAENRGVLNIEALVPRLPGSGCDLEGGSGSSGSIAGHGLSTVRADVGAGTGIGPHRACGDFASAGESR